MNTHVCTYMQACMYAHTRRHACMHTHTHTPHLFAAVVTCQRVKVCEPSLININIYFVTLLPKHCHSVKLN